MARLLAFLIMAAGLLWTSVASSQELVRPRWNYEGSAVCPDGYDYVQPWCRARGYYGGGRGYYRRSYGGSYAGEGIPPRWNSLGSAVCPQGYDYHARYDVCLPQR
jgi:hypothetical protein